MKIWKPLTTVPALLMLALACFAPAVSASAIAATPPTPLHKGLDTSQRVTATGYSQIKAGGYSFMGRYLEISKATGALKPGGKIYFITKTELDAAKKAGVDIFLIYEWSTGKSNLPKGFTTGVQDAKIAQAALTKLGLPLNTPVYYSLDAGYPINRVTIQNEVDYFKGINSIIGDVTAIGSYGSLKEIPVLKQQGLISWVWWARWKDNNPSLANVTTIGAHMYQSTAIIKRGGVSCDQDFAYTDNFGQIPAASSDSSSASL